MFDFPRPTLDEFYDPSVGADFLKFDPERTEFANKILSLETLSPENEYLIDEVYDNLSQKAFNSLFPNILDAYVTGIFKVSGNLAPKIWDTIPDEETEMGGLKYGVAHKVKKFKAFKAALSPQQKQDLMAAIDKMEQMADQ